MSLLRKGPKGPAGAVVPTPAPAPVLQRWYLNLQVARMTKFAGPLTERSNADPRAQGLSLRSVSRRIRIVL